MAINLELITRRMQSQDLFVVVQIHMEAFQGFFLTFLGPCFLYHLYQGILEDDSGITLVCEQQGKIIGFVAGSDHPQGLYLRLLKKRWWHFGMDSVGAFIKDIRILPRLLRAFNKPEDVANDDRCGTLMSIAVLPGIQSRGVGRKLVAAFLEVATERKLAAVNLTTDRLNNDAANRFYLGLGFSLIRSYTTPEGRQMNEYKIDL